MDKKIIFATTNSGKLKVAEDYLHPVGWEVEGQKLDLVEIQSNLCEESAISKAKQAYAVLKKPVMVQDGGLNIPSMGHLPGAFTKYFLEEIKPAGFIKLIDTFDPQNRVAYFSDVIAFYNGESLEIFKHKYWGTIVKDETAKESLHDWGRLWRIFIPRGSTKTLGKLTHNYAILKEPYDQGEISCWEQLTNYLKDRK